MARWNLLASNKGIHDPLETFLALNHLDDELSLDDLVVLENVRLKLLVAAANLRNHIVSFLFEMDLVESNQVEGALDVHYWNCDVVLLDQPLEVLLKFDISSRNKLHGRLDEEGPALVINFSVGNAGILGMTLDVMLVLSVLIDLLLSDSSDHFFLFDIETLQLGIQPNFPIVIKLDQFLPLHLFCFAPLPDHLILLIPLPTASVSLVFQIYLPSLPQILVFPLSDDLEAPFLSFVEELVVPLKEVVVLLDSSLNALHVGRASRLTLPNNLFNFPGVEPKLGLLEQSEVSDDRGLRSRLSRSVMNVDPMILLEQLIQSLACLEVVFTVGLKVVVFNWIVDI